MPPRLDMRNSRGMAITTQIAASIASSTVSPPRARHASQGAKTA